MARGGNANLGGGLGKFTELRSRLLFVLGALVVYRIGCYIPVPGVNPEAMLQLMEAQKGTIVDMFNMFSGGALQRFSLFALNVVPYISASIVVHTKVGSRSPLSMRSCMWVSAVPYTASPSISST